MNALRTPVVAARRLAPSWIFVAVTWSVMGVHSLARDHRWRHEWLWATYQFHFGVLLLGPVLGGVGAWVGGRARQGRWLTHPAGRTGPVVLPLVVAVGASWMAYLLAWAIPATIVLRSGTTDRPGFSTLATFGPALAAIAAYLAVGFAAGVALPGRLVAPFTAIVAFGLTMLGWIAGAERLVRLGGAGTTMASLRPATSVQIAQIGWYGTVAVVVAWWAAHRLAGSTDGRRLTRAGVAAVGVLASWLALTSAPLFDHPRSSDVCVGRDGVSICAPPPYAAALRPLARELARPLVRMRGAGVPIGRRVHLGAMVGLFEPEPTDDVLAGELFNVLGVGNCWSDDVADDVTNLSIWVARLVGATVGAPASAVPAELRGDDPHVQDTWAAAAFQRVTAACPAGR